MNNNFYMNNDFNNIINKLFNYLLNRNPTQEEYNLLQNKNHNQINNYILGIKEYKDFLDEQRFIINNILLNEIGIIDNDLIIEKLFHKLRENIKKLLKK